MKDYTSARKQIGSLLASYRKQKKITQKEISQKIFLDRSAISKIEHGEYNLPLFRIIDYCREVSLPLSDLIDMIESEYPPSEEEHLN